MPKTVLQFPDLLAPAPLTQRLYVLDGISSTRDRKVTVDAFMRQEVPAVAALRPAVGNAPNGQTLLAMRAGDLERVGTQDLISHGLSARAVVPAGTGPTVIDLGQWPGDLDIVIPDTVTGAISIRWNPDWDGLFSRTIRIYNHGWGDGAGGAAGGPITWLGGAPEVTRATLSTLRNFVSVYSVDPDYTCTLLGYLPELLASSDNLDLGLTKGLLVPSDPGVKFRQRPTDPAAGTVEGEATLFTRMADNRLTFARGKVGGTDRGRAPIDYYADQVITMGRNWAFATDKRLLDGSDELLLPPGIDPTYLGGAWPYPGTPVGFRSTVTAMSCYLSGIPFNALSNWGLQLYLDVYSAAGAAVTGRSVSYAEWILSETNLANPMIRSRSYTATPANLRELIVDAGEFVQLRVHVKAGSVGQLVANSIVGSVTLSRLFE